MQLVQNGNADKSTRLNFNLGANVSLTIMTEADIQEARERNQLLREEGANTREHINNINQRLTVGRLAIKGGHYHLDENVLAHVQRRQTELNCEEQQKRQKEELQYLKSCYIADRALKRQGGNLDVMKWKNLNDLLIYIKPLKKAG